MTLKAEKAEKALTKAIKVQVNITKHYVKMFAERAEKALKRRLKATEKFIESNKDSKLYSNVVPMRTKKIVQLMERDYSGAKKFRGVA